MSGLEIPGLAIGGVSFFFQAFAGCIQGYELIADACRLEKAYHNILIKVKIEEHRLFDWARSIGLDYTDERLVLNHMSKNLIMGILEQQQKLLFTFGRLDKKYAKLASPSLVDRTEGFVFDAEHLLENGVNDQGDNAVRFPKTDNLLEKVREFTAQLKTAPRRLKWASLDKEKAEGLVADLVHFNDKLHEALDKAQRDSLREEQLRTSYQIVLLNRTMENLVQIVQSQRIESSPRYPALLHRSSSVYSDLNHRAIARQPDTRPLAALAQFAAVNLQSEEDYGIGAVTDSIVSALDLNQTAEEIHDNRIELSAIETVETIDDIDDAERTEGTYGDRSVWIEWKLPEMDPTHANGTGSLIHERITTLAGLLREMNKIVQFRAPQCLGYFEDEDNGRYGFVFAKPDHATSDESPTTLRDLLAEDMPPLADRITLMRLLAETIEQFHAVGWLHKGLRSANILFFKDSETGLIDIGSPYISGFEYSRPATRDDMTQRPSDDPGADMYRHPATQSNNHTAGFKQTFDLYSLGIVLLEIAYWQPIDEILGIDLSAAKPKDIFSVRKRLLEDTRYEKHVRGYLGVAAQQVIWSCLTGPEGFGLSEPCDEKNPFTSATLGWEFGQRVVKRLALMKGL